MRPHDRCSLGIAILAMVVLVGCGLVTTDYTLGAGNGGAAEGGANAGNGGGGGSGGNGGSPCNQVLFDTFDGPIDAVWEATGDVSINEADGIISLVGASTILSLTPVDLSGGGCVTAYFDDVVVMGGDDLVVLGLSDLQVVEGTAMETDGTVIRGAFADGVEAMSLPLTGLFNGELNAFWRMCLNADGDARFFVSLDGVEFSDVTGATAFSVDFDLSRTLVSMVVRASSSASLAKIHAMDVCAFDD